MSDAGAKLDALFMGRAIELARQGQREGSGGPIGCVIVRNGQVLAEGFNEVFTNCDPTAHAEIVTIRRATAAAEVNDLRGATLYSTLQPCGMCSMACIWAKIGRIVFGAGRGDVNEDYFEVRHLDTLDFIHSAYRDDLTLEGGVLKQQCASLYHGPEDVVPIEQRANL